MATRARQYEDIRSSLLSTDHIFLSLPTSPAPVRIPQSASHGLLSTIASLSLHPTIEATLHILNQDLPSAHFLVRHAQSAPAWEMMYLHGILHRIEGDVNNARCWYGDVTDSDVLKQVWTNAEQPWEKFLDRVEAQKETIAGRGEPQEKAGQVSQQSERADLQRMSLWELKRVLRFCEDKFGTGEVFDAGGTWVQPEAHIADKSDAMIVGGEGWREF